MEIKLEDLVRTCERCNGTGRVDERYPQTTGYGLPQRDSLTGTCPDCGGTRGELTESGKAIAGLFDFLKQG